MTSQVKQLPPEEDQTGTFGFERASRNIIHVQQGHCPQCLTPTGYGRGQKTVIKVLTAEGIDHWCEECTLKGIEKGICLKFRGMSKKERKRVRKTLKQKERQHG